MKVTEYIPPDKLVQFHEILCATGGRYLRNPFLNWDRVVVCYEPGDYVAQCEALVQRVTPIRDVRRYRWWHVELLRCGLLV